MENDWRLYLYPLGFVASIAFFIRIFIQWTQTEKKRRVFVSDGFWKFSLFGNITLVLHSVVQLHYFVAVLQTIHAVISWRNLNIRSDKSYRLSVVLAVLIVSLLGVTSLFYFQTFDFQVFEKWIRHPTIPWFGKQTVAFSRKWHLMGLLGMVLFSSRFILQWCHLEKSKESKLNPSFWWLSLVGSCLSLIYFITLWDVVHILAYSLGFIPYLRNLMFSYRMIPRKLSNTGNGSQSCE